MSVLRSQNVPRSHTVTAGVVNQGDLLGQAMVADWFSRLILRPLDKEAVLANRFEDMLEFIADLGDELGMEAAAQAIMAFLREHAPEEIEKRLGHVYVVLFEGISGPEAVSLYERSYAGETRRQFQTPLVEILSVLRELDASVGAECREPPDHLAIELGILAEALRQGNHALSRHMARRLSRWVPAVKHAVSRTTRSEFYGAVFALIDAFVSGLASSLGGDWAEAEDYY
ncbi:molecular chaperone TorD family protein [Bradyrhizobium sp. Leo170]|uniref:TorD/DmsD family molecular chaperone n=1 Tax=Bradyrhizobium sp. Leo170 TaxID=1571199 RepID=UPI00102E85A5|nr:molecular chaperone TorD family protein [Bradyrhizobium sp. Leo170]TAI61923.1 cytoplasmic chaperone TorD family protein [Bradyrhizobium sp. Leo170]